MRETRSGLSSNGKSALDEQIKALKSEKEAMNVKTLSYDERLEAIRKKKLSQSRDGKGNDGT